MRHMSSAIDRSHGFLEGVGRIRLHYQTWEVSGPRAALVLIHGLSDHGGRYERFGQEMASHGYSTYALDLRGHGRSEGRRGHVRRFDQLLQDVDRFRREVEGLVPLDCPSFLIGQSMGGLIALRYLEEYNPSFLGAVLAAPWLGTAMAVPHWKIGMAQVLTRLAPALPLNAKIEAADLSHDRAVVEEYRADPLVHGRITPRLFTEVATAMGQVTQRADRISVPLLFMLPGSDRLVRTDRSRNFARSIQHVDVTVKLFPDAYHELFNELERTLVMSQLREWLGARLA